jgi:hypothetical protein
VRLNDLTPAFDTRAAECTPQVYPASHRCSPLHPFRDKATGMLDKIINGSIAVGTAGKVTEISQTYETTFDESAFNQAVDEALVNSGLDAERRQLISLLDAYQDESEAARAELRVTGHGPVLLRSAVEVAERLQHEGVQIAQAGVLRP